LKPGEKDEARARGLIPPLILKNGVAKSASGALKSSILPARRVPAIAYK